MTSRLTILGGLVVVVLAAAFGTFGYMRAHERPRFLYEARALSDSDYGAMAAKPGWRQQRLTVAAGVELRGLRRAPLTPGGPWILFFSGNSAHMLGESQQLLDALCAERGWGGIVWAYRGFDSSGGSPDPAALTADGFTAYSSLLTAEKIQPSAVHVVGFSLGTSIAAAVAAHAYQQPPATLILLAPMTVLYMGDRTQLRLHRYETSKWLERIASPTLVVHGARDTTLEVGYGRTVAAALGARAKLLEVPELGHQDLLMSQAVQVAVRAFISQHTVGTTAAPAEP
jgi:pimeloyl-ACP methyl ester carboxylesterase